MDSQAQIVISDTGQGIGPEFLPYVFEPFRQADSTSARTHGGLGLGLAIVRHLAEAHGGGVRADSRGAGQGTTFTVSLPLLSVPLEPAEESISPRDARVPLLHGARVLVTDDNDDTRALLKIFLELGGAEVAVAASADEALQMLDAFRPEVLVCDIGMPGTDGYSFMRKIRAEGRRVPAVAVTGYVAWEDRERALAAGYQGHLAKPVEQEELIREVARLSGRQTAA
jgi:CheY-like chemotaxis protein